MNCAHFPTCREPAHHIPVIHIPTIRTVGLVLPALNAASLDRTLMERMGLSVAMAIRQYEAALADYKQHSTDVAYCPEPTLLIGEALCLRHSTPYRFLDYFGQENWLELCDEARARGVLLDLKEVKIEFKPVGWEPPSTHMEIKR